MACEHGGVCRTRKNVSLAKTHIAHNAPCSTIYIHIYISRQLNDERAHNIHLLEHDRIMHGNSSNLYKQQQTVSATMLLKFYIVVLICSVAPNKSMGKEQMLMFRSLLFISFSVSVTFFLATFSAPVL